MARVLAILSDSRNHGTRDTYKFHIRLESDRDLFAAMYRALSHPNPSRGTGITHAKFLCLLSALRNRAVPPAQTQLLIEQHARAWRDIYYKRLAHRAGIKLPSPSGATPSVAHGSGAAYSSAAD